MGRREASLRDDPSFGVDSYWSWVTVGFLSWLLCMAMVGHQALGVLFYGIVDTYGVNRQLASWPLVVSGSLTTLAGPAMGYLCRRFSCQSVLIVSSVIAGASTCICYLANSIMFLTVSYGVIHGLATSGIFVAVNVLASQHFEKRRTTSCSVIFTMNALGAIFVPPLGEFFRVTYGVRGTFLLLGGLILNGCPAVIVLKSPHWMRRRTNASSTKNPELSPKTAATPTEPPVPVLCIDGNVPSEETERGIGRNSNKMRTAKTLVANLRQNLPFCQKPSSPSTESEKEGPSQTGTTAVVKQFFTIAFAVDAISFAVIILALTLFMMLCVDIATDNGVSPSLAVFLLNAFAVTNIALRAVSGVVIDSGLVTLETVMLGGYVVQAVAFELYVWSDSFEMMLLCSALIGATSGARIFLQAPLLVQDFGIDSVALTMGGTSFFMGIVGFARPVLVGYFRDHHGSYDGLLHILAIVNAVLAAIWAVRVFLQKRKQKSFNVKPEE
ncbi:monocarboxylate transporter 7-like [Haemaphysalis longicornis]